MLEVVDKQVSKLVQEAEDQVMRLRELSYYFQEGSKRAEALRSAVSTFSDIMQLLWSLTKNDNYLTQVAL